MSCDYNAKRRTIGKTRESALESNCRDRGNDMYKLCLINRELASYKRSNCKYVKKILYIKLLFI